MQINRIRDYFISLSGMSEMEAHKWEPLFSSAKAYICGRLREGVDIAAHSDRLCFCAAGVAYAKYCALLSAGGQDAFRVGDLSMTPSKNTAKDNQNIEQMILSLSPDLLKYDGFLFEQMPSQPDPAEAATGAPGENALSL